MRFLRCFEAFIVILVVAIGIIAYQSFNSLCVMEQEVGVVRISSQIEQISARITSLLCTAQGGRVEVLLYGQNEEISEKEIRSTCAVIDLPFNCVSVIIKWNEKSNVCIEIGELKIEAEGPHGIIALQLNSDKIGIKSSSNLLNDPRCFISINGTKCKDPSIKYYLV